MIDESTQGESVRKELVVEAPLERAFRVFTEGLDRWWPRSHHIGRAELGEAVLEPREGGRWYERGVDGSECEWGRVLVWDPPRRLVLDWQITTRWQFDPALHTEVDVRFSAEGPRRTRVVLEHRGLERYGAERETARKTFESPGGWPGLLAAFDRAAREG